MAEYKFVIENIPENNAVRLIIFEKNNHWCVYNIAEGSVSSEKNISYTSRFFDELVEETNCDSVTIENENIDYGRAKLRSTKIKKIIETIIKENRFK